MEQTQSNATGNRVSSSLTDQAREWAIKYRVADDERRWAGYQFGLVLRAQRAETPSDMLFGQWLIDHDHFGFTRQWCNRLGMYADAVEWKLGRVPDGPHEIPKEGIKALVDEHRTATHQKQSRRQKQDDRQEHRQQRQGERDDTTSRRGSSRFSDGQRDESWRRDYEQKRDQYWGGEDEDRYHMTQGSVEWIIATVREKTQDPMARIRIFEMAEQLFREAKEAEAARKPNLRVV